MENKKPIYKKVWFWIIVVIVLLIVIGILGGDNSKVNTNNNNDAAIVDNSVNTDNTSVIELIAGEQGEYGKLITMNEESFYAYYVPAGTYTVENKGNYMTQVTVYEGFAKNEETGYDEYTNSGDVKVIDVGKTQSITVPEGWFIEIHEPSHIALTIVK